MARKLPPDQPDTGEYEVGYGKPPKHTQFKPGQSGNPKGGRKCSQSIRTLMTEALNEPILITEGGIQRRITKREALCKSMVTRAINGDSRHLKLVTKFMEQDELPPDSNTEGRITIEFVNPPPRPDDLKR
jgi:hypothetical protein